MKPTLPDNDIPGAAASSLSTPKVSIILCTKNRAASLDETLNSMQGVTVPPGLQVELVLVDNGSTDRTASIIERHLSRSHIPIRAVVEPVEGKSHALNAGIQAAHGEILLFTDDDLRFPGNWVSGMIAPILSGEADFVQGGIRWSTELLAQIPTGSYLPRLVASTPHKGAAELRVGLIGANMAIRRDAILSAGGFDEALGPGALGLGEETLLAFQLVRLGYRKILALDVEVEHHFDPIRLTSIGINAMARSKGRSLGYIDYHWNHQRPPSAWFALLLKSKLLIRTLCTPSAWSSNACMPEWKLSYLASLARHGQMLKEAKQRPKYNRSQLAPEQAVPNTLV